MTTVWTAEAPCEINDYGLIGDGRTGALVSKTGSVDWLCWPHFDSASLFAALLDRARGGHWQIAPEGPFSVERTYVGRTNVLETRFTTASGRIAVTDFMPVADEGHLRTHLTPEQEIIRIVRCTDGAVDVRMRYEPKPAYAEETARLKDRGTLGIRIKHGPGNLSLHAPVPVTVSPASAEARWTMHRGETAVFRLTFATESPEILPVPGEAEESLKRTLSWWENWISSLSYDGPHGDAVARSVLTLKLLQFASTGAFVAAPTTSLPERPGGDLNWDYRYCWLRDASFTIEALHGTGFVPEAEEFAEWIMHATRLTWPKLMVLYDIYGNVTKPERALPNLGGYRGSKPVRVGNGARKQVQLDLYGELIAGTATLIRGGGQADRDTEKTLDGIGAYICAHWREPDTGIWESREKPTVHTHSLVMAWKGLDELIALHEKGLIRAKDAGRFRHTREEIRVKIETACWSDVLGSYVGEAGGTAVDASLLILAITGFHPANDPRIQRTYRRIQDDLGAGHGLLYRYRGKPGAEEGAFGICGFWAATYLALGGDTPENADRYFTGLLASANDLGFFAEETDPATLSGLGNFPQAFTHLGLINAALALRRAEQRKTT